MNKAKTNSIGSFLHSSTVTALGIMLLFVSIGAVALPNLFADTSSKVATPTVTATPTNTASYSVKESWKGTSPAKWTYSYATNGNTIASKVVDNSVTSVTINGLTCGQQYGFRVVATDSQGNAVSDDGYDSATPPCPAVHMQSFGSSGTSVVAAWTNTAGFDTSYTFYLKAAAGSYVAHTTTSTSASIAGSCNTGYSGYVVPSAGGQSGGQTNVFTTTTASCPVVAAAPPAAPAPTPTKTVTKSSATATRSAASSPATAGVTPAAAPTTPTNFAAEVQSEKLVQLTWDADTGNIDHYVINRSTDNATWTQLTTTTATSYQDSADFNTTYYYQLQAVGSDGQTSGLATAQATTDSFSSSSSTIISDDNNAVIKVPSGAVDGSFSCTLDTDQTSLVNIPAGQHVLFGPYDLICIDSNGNIIKNFKKPVAVTIKVGSANGYGNLSARSSTDQGWDTIKSSYNAKSKDISFTLTAAKTFAAFGQQKHSYAGLIIGIFLLLLVATAAVFGFLWWRRRRPAPEVAAATAVAQRSAEEEFRQALAAPDCTHKSLAQPVNPSSAGCLECEQQHTQWKALRICLICGHVGCSDDSDQQHALKHYQETGHPIVYDYADPNGNSIGWCYTDQTYI